MNHTYKIGETVVIVGNHGPENYGGHYLAIGKKCEIIEPSGLKDFYRLRGPDEKTGILIHQTVHISDFRPADTSYSLKEYRDRELLPLVDDEQPSDIAHGI